METTTVVKPNQTGRYKGLVMVIIGASLWGLSGTVAQRLFQGEGFTPEWLVTVRTLVSGVLLLMLGAMQNKEQSIWAVWKDKRDCLRLLVFGLIGMLGVQYTYFLAIQLGNAATATLLQYMGPLFITIYLALRWRRMPTRRELGSVALAMFGTFLLVTNGSLDHLSLSGWAVFWGLASAVSAAFYTLFPSGLINRWGSAKTVGWAMIIAGVGFGAFNPPWQVAGQHWSWTSAGYVAFVILFGTLLAFYLYIDSLRYITATETSMLASAEPLSATLASIVWLQVPLGFWETIGGICIVATVAILSTKPKTRSQ